MNPVVDGILGGWRLVGINTMTSGMPVNLSYSPATAFSVSGSPTYRPNLIGDPLTPSDQRTIINYLNPATVEIPTDRSQPFGNAPRNVARGPGFTQFDLGLHKAFGLGRDNTRLELRIEAFNLFNQTELRHAERATAPTATSGRSRRRPRRGRFSWGSSFTSDRQLPRHSQLQLQETTLGVGLGS